MGFSVINETGRDGCFSKEIYPKMFPKSAFWIYRKLYWQMVLTLIVAFKFVNPKLDSEGWGGFKISL